MRWPKAENAFPYAFAAFGVIAVVLIAWRPHFLEHDWKWSGGENFQQDYGECRSQSLLGGFFSPDVDISTLEALMRGRGWIQRCDVCGEERWP